MFVVKDIDKKTTTSPRKRNVNVKGVRIENGNLVDEEGSIIDRIYEAIGDIEFELKITIEFPDENDEINDD